MELSAARCIVTGAASGIGRAVAVNLLSQGASVIGADRDTEGLGALALQGAETIVADLATPEGRAVVAEAADVTHLVNAAGTIALTPLPKVSESEWDDLFAINARALFFLTQEIGGRLPSEGAVVNVASIAGKTASVVELAVYSATKAAVLSLTRSFAYAWAARGVRVNAVCPGVIETPMNAVVLDGIAAARGIARAEIERARIAAVPLGRSAPPEDVADVISFLLSDQARYMTGQAVNISGGLVTY